VTDHPVLLGVAKDIRDATEDPVWALFWFPDWTLFKLARLLVVLAALTATFYKLFDFIGLAHADTASTC